MISIIYENVKALCDKKGMSIRALEQKAGIANGTIGKWREFVPTVETIGKVAAVLHVSIDYLVKGNIND